MPSFDPSAIWKELLYDPKYPLLFNNGFFVFFFALFMLLFYVFRNKTNTRRYIFCFFSLYFFYKASGSFVGLVILSAIVDFILSNAIYKQTNALNKKLLLLGSIVFNLGMLFCFKYTNFFISIYNDFSSGHIHPLNVLLPVGISFYTFENLSYTIDIYRGQFEPARKFSDYLLFLSFFPKLVMGPIVRAHDFVPQINQPFTVKESDFSKGFYLIISGLFKKLIISDYITLNFVDYVFDDPARYTGLENLFAVYGYAAVIYCDFSGYSDVAIGIAKWLGFNIPTNFLSPYQSKNITEFWRRWHISLSSWLKDYLYIPLGGNKKAGFGTFLFAGLFLFGVAAGCKNLLHLSWLLSIIISIGTLLLFLIPALVYRENKSIFTGFNLLTTMLLGGFWHGASWNFIIWGALHGVALAVHKIWLLLTKKLPERIQHAGWMKAIAIFITFHFVCFCWIFFKAENFTAATAMIQQIVGDFDWSVWGAFAKNYQSVLWMMAIAAVIHALPDTLADKLLQRFHKIPLLAYLVAFFAFLLIYGVFKSSEQVLPIYLKF